MPKHHATAAYGKVEIVVSHILNFGTMWRWVVRSFMLYPGETGHDTHLIGDWVDPKAVLVGGEENESLSLSLPEM
jgi:hypothetical protein